MWAKFWGHRQSGGATNPGFGNSALFHIAEFAEITIIVCFEGFPCGTPVSQGPGLKRSHEHRSRVDTPLVPPD